MHNTLIYTTLFHSLRSSADIHMVFNGCPGAHLLESESEWTDFVGNGDAGKERSLPDFNWRWLTPWEVVKSSSTDSEGRL